MKRYMHEGVSENFNRHSIMNHTKFSIELSLVGSQSDDKSENELNDMSEVPRNVSDASGVDQDLNAIGEG